MDLVLELAHAGAELLHLRLALLGALLHVQDAHHAGEVDALVGELVDELEPLDVRARVQARVAARALRVHQALGLVDAQGLGVHARELRRDGDHVQRLVACIVGHINPQTPCS